MKYVSGEIAHIITTNYYKKYGFTVVSKEKDNIGWDLEADNGDTSLKIEVKGLSGDSINIGLTPNEYAMMNKYSYSYRISVVTKALTKSPKLSIIALKLSLTTLSINKFCTSLVFENGVTYLLRYLIK